MLVNTKDFQYTLPQASNSSEVWSLKGDEIIGSDCYWHVSSDFESKNTSGESKDFLSEPQIL